MATSPKSAKRKLNRDAPISPPSLKRRVQSTTTKNAVASFFTPASLKPPEKTTWQVRAPNDDSPSTLLVGKYSPTSDTMATQHLRSTDIKRNKVAAFDFDSTLVETASGKKFASDPQDWRWWHPSVPTVLRKLYLEDGYRIVVISNQGGISLSSEPKTPKARLTSFKTKVSAVFSQLDLPINIYAATEKDIFRKPMTGMWTELLEDCNIHKPGDLDLENSIFVGDAGGRHAMDGKPEDFSYSDRNFAENVGITFHTPEEFFLGEAPKPFTRTFMHSEYLSTTEDQGSYPRKNKCDIVLLCGSPAAGKSSWYWRNLEPLNYERINQDLLKSREKCIKVADQYLKDGKSVAVDNTNANADTRSKWVELAKKHSIPIRCVLFTTKPEVCEHNDAVRALNKIMNPEQRKILPSLAFRGFASRYQPPKLSEGFQDITEVAFKFRGTDVEREIWTRHWT